MEETRIKDIVVAIPNNAAYKMYESIITNFEDRETSERRRVLGIEKQVRIMEMKDIPRGTTVIYVYNDMEVGSSIEEYIGTVNKYKEYINIIPYVERASISSNTYRIESVMREAFGKETGREVFKNRINWIIDNKINTSEVEIVGASNEKHRIEIWLDINGSAVELLGKAKESGNFRAQAVKMEYRKAIEFIEREKGLILQVRDSRDGMEKEIITLRRNSQCI